MARPFGKRFGDVIDDANDNYRPGARVKVTFVSANPRNDVRAESTFLADEKLDEISGRWTLHRHRCQLGDQVPHPSLNLAINRH